MENKKIVKTYKEIKYKKNANLNAPQRKKNSITDKKEEKLWIKRMIKEEKRKNYYEIRENREKNIKILKTNYQRLKETNKKNRELFSQNLRKKYILNNKNRKQEYYSYMNKLSQVKKEEEEYWLKRLKELELEEKENEELQKGEKEQEQLKENKEKIINEDIPNISIKLNKSENSNNINN